MGARKKTVSDAVREVCLSFPEAEEGTAHGAPHYHVRGKTFAMYTINHHGDGRVSLWLNSPPGAQEIHVRGEPKHFFIPPYVGPRGWLGVELNKGLSWKRIALLVREAYEKVAHPKLRAAIGATVDISPPTVKLTKEQIDPMQSARARRLLKLMRKICLAWPETSETVQFGYPVWKGGKKSFALAYFRGDALKAGFWVGVDRQGLFTADKRYTIPMYMGHNGWIELDASKGATETELRDLARDSYRHFANKRMLTLLESSGAALPRTKRKS